MTIAHDAAAGSMRDNRVGQGQRVASSRVIEFSQAVSSKSNYYATSPQIAYDAELDRLQPQRSFEPAATHIRDGAVGTAVRRSRERDLRRRMQRDAAAEREARKIIHAEGELQASENCRRPPRVDELAAMTVSRKILTEIASEQN